MGTYDTPIRYGTFYTRLHETIHIVQVIWSSFQIGNRFGINANVIENNSKITIDPKISKDTTAPKKKKTKKPDPKFQKPFGWINQPCRLVCVLSGRVAGDSKPEPALQFARP